MKAMYFIAIVLPEPLLSEVSAIKHALSKKYKTYASLKSPAHITLVPPFFFKEEDEYLLVRMLKEFRQDIPSFPVQLNGFGSFPPRVIFVNPEKSEPLNVLHAALGKHVRNYLPERKKQSPPFHAHVTVANRDWSEYDFYAAWEEMRSQPFEGSFIAEHYSLLKLKKEKWKILANFSWK